MSAAAAVLPVHVDTAATLAEFATTPFVTGHGYMLKHPADLARYAAIIEATKPELIIETGTMAGESAAWFAEQGLDVITVDFRARLGDRAALRIKYPRLISRIRYISGDSIHPATVAEVAALAVGRRTMVSLDSCHTHAHVAAEIAAYGPMVTPGCYLVVEDGIFAFADARIWRKHHFGEPALGNPMDAIVQCLEGNPAWARDVDIEAAHRISHHPAGWWVRQP